MDEAPKTKRKKTGGRTKGTPNRRTVSRQVAAELALHRSGKIKLAREVLADIMNLAYELMRKACGEKVDTKEFNRYADMAMKAAVELIPYEQPRLNAITVMPGGIASKEEFERRQR